MALLHFPVSHPHPHTTKRGYRSQASPTQSPHFPVFPQFLAFPHPISNPRHQPTGFFRTGKVPDGRRATYRKEHHTSPAFWSAAIFAFFPTRRNFAAPYPTYPIETHWIRASPKAAALVLSSEKRRYRICLSPYGFSHAFHIFPFLTANERRVRNRSRDNR